MRHLISLGARCDVAFQLRMHSGDNTAHFFDWLSISAKGVIETLRRDFGVFAPDQLRYDGQFKPGTIVDGMTGTRFHHHFPHTNGWITPQFLIAYPSFRAKFQHLARRFRDYAATRPVTFVRQDISAAQAAELETVFFERFPDADARFLYLNGRGDAFETRHGKGIIFAVETSSLGDPAAWGRMLVSEGLVASPYRLSALEILGPGQEGYDLSADNRFSDEQLETAARVNPANGHFHCELARLYRHHDRLREARKAVEAALALDPDNPLFHLEDVRLSYAAKTINSETYANKLAEFAGADDPYGIALEAAEALIVHKDYARAAECCNSHLQRHPTDASAMETKARCLRRLRRFKEAETAALASLSLAPDVARTHALLAQVLLAQKRPNEALVPAQRACDLNPGHASLYALAEVYEATGESDKAVALYERILPIGSAVNAKAVERLTSLRAVSLPINGQVETAPVAETTAVKPSKTGWKGLFGGRA